jgi:hypothetical protein
MIRPEMRRASLATFPAGTPLTVVAPARADFAALLRDRNDPAAALAELHDGPALDLYTGALAPRA